ncbi:MAG: nucleotide exchange factor GrpE [Promethearchaeota archaeon]
MKELKNMVFEDYDDFFNARKSLEDPYRKITISRSEYERLQHIAAKHETLLKKFTGIKSEKSKLEHEIKLLMDDGRKLKQLEEENEKLLNSLLRTRADFENYKKSIDRGNENYRQRIQERIIRKLVKHAEDLTRALKILETLKNADSMKNGFEMILQNFNKILEEEGVRPMNCEGEKFDPFKQEALLVEERDDIPENTIIEEIDKGYFINNAILKPAGVKVSKLKSE